MNGFGGEKAQGQERISFPYDGSGSAMRLCWGKGEKLREVEVYLSFYERGGRKSRYIRVSFLGPLNLPCRSSMGKQNIESGKSEISSKIVRQRRDERNSSGRE